MAFTNLVVEWMLVTILLCMYRTIEDRGDLHCVILHLSFALFFVHRTPMRKAEEGELSGDTWRVYSYVTRHFLGSISPDMRYVRTTAIIKINNEMFECSGKN